MPAFYLVFLTALSPAGPCLYARVHGPGPTFFGQAHPDETLARLQEELTSAKTRPDERKRLVDRITEIGTPEAFGLLRKQFDRERAREVRRTLLDALVDHHQASADLLREAGLDADPYLRARSLGAFEILDTEEAGTRAHDILLYDEDPRVRQSAIELLGRRLDEKSAAFLLESCAPLAIEEQRLAVQVLARFEGILQVLGKRASFWAEAAGDPARRLLGTLVLAARADRSSKGFLQTLARDEDRRVAAAAALGVDRVRGQGTGSSIKRLLARARDADERREVLDVVGRCGLSDRGLLEVMQAELRRRDWRLRALAAEALGEILAADDRENDVVAALAALFDGEKVWQVRVAVIRALGACRKNAAVESLIGILEKARGRERVESARALGRLTGMGLGRSAATWRRWWTDHRAGFQPPPPDVTRWIEVSAPDQRYAFYGLDVESEQVAFALDVSGSMQGRPIQVLREQLTQVIKGMPARTLLNMVFFASTVKRWKDQLVPLTPSSRQEALLSVRYLEANGGTNMWGALLACLEDPRVDTVFLLSDGQPTAGEIQDVATIHTRLAEMNRHRRVAFHIVLIGYTSDPLRKLALESGGTYVEVKR